MILPPAESTKKRAIRDLVCPEIEEPVIRRTEDSERRRSLRFARHLPGTLITGGQEHPITCVDVGYGGMRVIAPAKISVPAGRQVGVRVQLGSRSFGDVFSVIRTESTAESTAIHLGL